MAGTGRTFIKTFLRAIISFRHFFNIYKVCNIFTSVAAVMISSCYFFFIYIFYIIFLFPTFCVKTHQSFYKYSETVANIVLSKRLEICCELWGCRS